MHGKLKVSERADETMPPAAGTYLRVNLMKTCPGHISHQNYFNFACFKPIFKPMKAKIKYISTHYFQIFSILIT